LGIDSLAKDTSGGVALINLPPPSLDEIVPDGSLIYDNKAAYAVLLGMQLEQLVLLRSNISRDAEERAARTRCEALRMWRLAAEAEDAAAELEQRRAISSELLEIHSAIVDAVGCHEV
jgi:hypothetical protein